MMSRNCLTIALLSSALLASRVTAQVVAPAPGTSARPEIATRLVPAPAAIRVDTGAPFALTATTGIVVDRGSAEVRRTAEMLAAILRPSTSFPIVVTATTAATATAAAAPGTIRLRLDTARAALGDEGYALTVTPDSVLLVARRPAGLFNGSQTIRQLLPAEIESHMKLSRDSWSIPAVTITDVPRFGWRGAMLDVARHFFTVQEVEQYIDILALYKLNVLHLHLTDDQGWRIAIDSRPKLTAVGGLSQVGGGAGGFYTKRDYRDIVRYAQARYITVVPEIEMPGHSNAALSAYPRLSCSTRKVGAYSGTDVGWSTFCPYKAQTYAFLEDVVREVAAMTPGPYLHIGGDEVQSLPDSQFVHFIERVQRIVGRHGKRMIGWEEISKAKLNPTTIAQQWKSDSVTAALAYGSKLIMSPANKVYIDMKYTATTELGLRWAALIDVRDAYDWDPATYMPGVVEANVVGVEAPMWSETVRNITAVEFLALPRLPAIAEVAWTPQSGRDWESFRARIATHAPRWRLLGINYYPSPQIEW